MKIESNISVCKIPGFYQDFIFAEKILFVKIYSIEVAVARYTLSLYIPAIAFLFCFHLLFQWLDSQC